MIVQEYFTSNGRNYIRTYSDAHRYVVRDGEAYSEANDPAEFNRTYIEGELIPINEDNSTSEAEELLNIILGEEP